LKLICRYQRVRRSRKSNQHAQTLRPKILAFIDEDDRKAHRGPRSDLRLFKEHTCRIAHRVEFTLRGGRYTKGGRETPPASVNAPCEGIHSAALDSPSKTGHAFEAIR
jgi:hypothetical protein